MASIKYTVPGFWDLVNGKKPGKKPMKRQKTRCSKGHVHISQERAAECDARKEQ